MYFEEIEITQRIDIYPVQQVPSTTKDGVKLSST